MNKRKRVIIIVVVIAIILVLLLAAAAIYKYLAPSSVQKPVSSIFELGEQEVALLVNGEELEERGIVAEKEFYVPAAIASDYMDQRIYVDTTENMLAYATEEGVIQAKTDATEYTVGKEKKTATAPILIKKDKNYYVSLTFIGERATCYFKSYTEPARLIIMSDKNKTYTFATVAKDTRIRTGPNKKYAYLVEVPEGTKVRVETEIQQENEYMAITTEDGVTGYVPIERIIGKKEETWKIDKEPTSFPQIGVEETICLGWHQVFNETSAQSLPANISQASAMNVISPTWYALSDNKGNFTSLGNTGYVTQAHSMGIQVWGLVNDFDDDLKLGKILGQTSTRTKLINGLVGSAIQYDLDGINIDFEKITADSADAYLQFLRELVLKCHANDLIVSVDNYSPASYNAYYDLEEQGRIVDYVILMAYDEHYAGSDESGSVSSINFVKTGVKNVLAKVPKERVITALPFYTRLWKEVENKSGEVSVSSSAYGMSGAESVLRSHGAEAKWDKKTEQYYAEYKADGATYKIWLEEETSLKKKMEVVKNNKVAGVAFWKLGFERAVTWTTIEAALKK